MPSEYARPRAGAATEASDGEPRVVADSPYPHMISSRQIILRVSTKCLLQKTIKKIKIE